MKSYYDKNGNVYVDEELEWEEFTEPAAAILCTRYPVMFHNRSDILYAKKYYEELLTDYELQETQKKGRYWDIQNGTLYILLDNETVLIGMKRIDAMFQSSGSKCITNVVFRGSIGLDFPDSLRGHYYNE